MNPYKNNWIEKKKGNKTQYYVMVPKIGLENVLVEAQYFNDYVDEQYYTELIGFIHSHCPAKEIRIDKIEKTKKKMKLDADFPIKIPQLNIGTEVNVNGSVENQSVQGNYYKESSKIGAITGQKQEEYYWLEQHLMDAISNLKKDSYIDTKLEVNNKTTVDLNVAKTVGIDAEYCKDYIFRIYVRT